MSTPWILEGTFDLSKSSDRLKVEDAVKAWEAQKSLVVSKNSPWVQKGVRVVLTHPWPRVEGEAGDEGTIIGIDYYHEQVHSFVVKYDRGRTVTHPGWHALEIVQCHPDDPCLKAEAFTEGAFTEHRIPAGKSRLLGAVWAFMLEGKDGASATALMNRMFKCDFGPAAVKQYDRLLSR